MNSKVAIASAGLAAALCLSADPGQAQEQSDYEAIVRLMRECARIADVPARVSCYDKTINADRLIAGSAQVQSGPANDSANASAPRPGRFGEDSLRQPTPRSADRLAQVILDVDAAERLEPGIYLLTLRDGSKWRFVDAAPLSYDAPRKGSQIELARASLGSFQMRYAGQRPIRIRRIR